MRRAAIRPCVDRDTEFHRTGSARRSRRDCPRDRRSRLRPLPRNRKHHGARDQRHDADTPDPRPVHAIAACAMRRRGCGCPVDAAPYRRCLRGSATDQRDTGAQAHGHSPTGYVARDASHVTPPVSASIGRLFADIEAGASSITSPGTTSGTISRIALAHCDFCTADAIGRGSIVLGLRETSRHMRALLVGWTDQPTMDSLSGTRRMRATHGAYAGGQRVRPVHSAPIGPQMSGTRTKGSDRQARGVRRRTRT